MAQESQEEILRRLEVAEQRIARLEERLEHFDLAAAERTETGGSEPFFSEVETEGRSGAVSGALSDFANPSILSLIGRTFLILSGAFLIRALTDAHTLPPQVGVGLGLVYGIVWLAPATRVAARSGRSSAFFSLSTALVCLPLIYEATLSKGLLKPPAAIVLLLAVWGLGVTVAYFHRLRVAAWVYSVGAGTTGLALAFGGGFWVPYCFAVLVMALSGLWLGYLLGWSGLAIVGTGVADAVVVALTLLNILRPGGLDTSALHPAPLLVLQLGLVTLFMASYLLRALLQNRHISVMEILQAATAMTIGFGGALQTSTSLDHGAGTVGVFAAVMAAFGYAVSFRHLDAERGFRRNFGFFTTVALFATVLAVLLLLGGPGRIVVLMVLTILAAWMALRWGRATLALHAAVFLAVGGLASGLVGHALRAFFGAPEPLPSAGSLGWMSAVLLLAGVGALLSFEARERSRGWMARAPKVIVWGVWVMGLLGLAASTVGTWLSLHFSEPWQDPVYHAWRTGSLSIAAVGCALVARSSRARELRAWVAPLLFAAALALLLGDLRSGRPATLVVSLVLFGSALIVAPRIR